MAEFGTALDETPDNINMLSPLVWKFQLHRAPTLNYFVQNINLPGVHLPPVAEHNPFVQIPHPGDHLQFDDLMINFKVDEDFANWLEIFNWMKALGYPNNFEERAALEDPTLQLGHGVRSDISLIVLNSQRVPSFDIVFRDAFPISLSSAIFDVTQASVKYIDAAATFTYISYDINPIN